MYKIREKRQKKSYGIFCKVNLFEITLELFRLYFNLSIIFHSVINASKNLQKLCHIHSSTLSLNTPTIVQHSLLIKVRDVLVRHRAGCQVVIVTRLLKNDPIERL